MVNSFVINFQMPYTTMLMLTCAFGGYDYVMKAYEEALKNDYKFGSYGDCLLII